MVPKSATLVCCVLFPQLQAHTHFILFRCMIDVLVWIIGLAVGLEVKRQIAPILS